MLASTASKKRPFLISREKFRNGYFSNQVHFFLIFLSLFSKCYPPDDASKLFFYVEKAYAQLVKGTLLLCYNLRPPEDRASEEGFLQCQDRSHANMYVLPAC